MGTEQDNAHPWVLLKADGAAKGDCHIAVSNEGGSEAELQVEAYYEAATGNVYACASDGQVDVFAKKPVVRMLGGIEGETGQILVLQQDGVYRRMARWDRLSPEIAARNGAVLRTLPQCGCGGSLGVPKLFDSFAQLGAYYYCMFVRTGEL